MDTTGLAPVLGLGILVIAAMAALAPLVMSLMARSFVSSAVSVMLLIGVLTSARGPTVIHSILAAVFYLTALLSASIILAGYRIETKIDALRQRTVNPPAPPDA